MTGLLLIVSLVPPASATLVADFDVAIRDPDDLLEGLPVGGPTYGGGAGTSSNNGDPVEDSCSYDTDGDVKGVEFLGTFVPDANGVEDKHGDTVYATIDVCRTTNATTNGDRYIIFQLKNWLSAAGPCGSGDKDSCLVAEEPDDDRADDVVVTAVSGTFVDAEPADHIRVDSDGPCASMTVSYSVGVQGANVGASTTIPICPPPARDVWRDKFTGKTAEFYTQIDERTTVLTTTYLLVMKVTSTGAGEIEFSFKGHFNHDIANWPDHEHEPEIVGGLGVTPEGKLEPKMMLRMLAMPTEQGDL